METTSMNFTRETVKALKARYKIAVNQNEETFTFQGVEFLTSYCKYLLEYLELKGVLNDYQ